MTCDVACVGQPFLDVTFAGLPRVPAPGEELLADDVLFTPGGLAIVAIGLARLGLRAAVVSPVGSDPAGRYLRAALEAEGVDWIGPEAPRTAITVVLPTAAEGGERAMATYQPPAETCTAEIARLAPQAVVTDLATVPDLEPGPEVYALAGDVAASRFAGAPPRALAGARCVLANEREAPLLTGCDDPEQAAAALADRAGAAVVTRGAAGAVGVEAGRTERAQAPAVEARDATGAGDLFAAAYVWADLAGLVLAERLRLAALYASLSLRIYTGAAGAATYAELVEAASELGLSVPEQQRTSGQPLHLQGGMRHGTQ